ncbi:MAG: 2-hydroxychromene-2-carboxylate isomerase [Myxococcota bacterium]|nr:2-hydroxychromene-2-carboxylate isomerase [Deltaproteobacteria bacterium]MDQ3341169.1 2-hydroxychromene-2-carboxylate isomerase [Myxococcota bacterium]
MISVEFLFDYASPYSFLANETLGAKLPGIGIEIDYRPVYLRGFDAFAKTIPFTAPKLAYTILDLRRCAADLGIELRVPNSFPINGLYALRGAIAAERAGRFAAYHQAMFQAAWQRGRDISTKDAVAALATELGFSDVAAVLDDASIKDELRANTDAAIKRGAFGLPTFFVGAEMFWGHDRIDQVAREITRVAAS